MMSRPRSVALPWYAAEHYEALRQILSDGGKLPVQYEAWRASTEQVEREVQCSGVEVVRVPIEPDTFKAWCRRKGLPADGSARVRYATEALVDEATRAESEQQEAPLRELYASSNGDRWHLVVDASSGHTFVRHTANEPSGGNVVNMALPLFLSLDSGGPEHQALWALIRTLVA